MFMKKTILALILIGITTLSVHSFEIETGLHAGPEIVFHERVVENQIASYENRFFADVGFDTFFTWNFNSCNFTIGLNTNLNRLIILESLVYIGGSKDFNAMDKYLIRGEILAAAGTGIIPCLICGLSANIKLIPKNKRGFTFGTGIRTRFGPINIDGIEVAVPLYTGYLWRF